MPRQRSIPTDIASRLVRTVAAEGRVARAGLNVIGPHRRGGGGNQSVLANAGAIPDDATSEAAPLLVMSVTAASIDPGGDHVAFDTVVAAYGFDGTVNPKGGAWVHPVSGRYLLAYEHEWDSFRGGGTIRLEVDGVLVPEGILLEGASGEQGVGIAIYDAAAGSVGKIHIDHDDASTQTCAAIVRLGISDPVSSDAAWTKVFSADVWDLTFDGTYWWTVDGTDTVTKRDAIGTALASFTGAFTAGRGITFDGSGLWVGADHNPDELLLRYSTSGALLTSIATGGTIEENHGVAWDGSHVWLVENLNKAIERWTTSGIVDSSFVAASTDMRGAAWHEDRLYIVDSTNGALLVYETDGTLVSTIDVSGAATNPTGVYIAGDGTLYVSKDGDGVYRRSTRVGD